MPRYFILALYPLIFALSVLAVYQARKLERIYPSTAWTLKRKFMLAFMFFQVYGVIRTSTVVRTFSWIDPIYLIGVLILCVGLNWFDWLLLRSARGIREKAAKMVIDPPSSGDGLLASRVSHRGPGYSER